MITGTIKKNWKMLITVLAAVIGVLAVYQPENAVCYAADNDTSAIEICWKPLRIVMAVMSLWLILICQYLGWTAGSLGILMEHLMAMDIHFTIWTLILLQMLQKRLMMATLKNMILIMPDFLG